MPLERLTKLDPRQLGRFTILARLGGGGMGNVYLAEADDGTPAAVKVIRAEMAKDPQFRARFRREVEAGRRVHNRCIARYLDADTFAPSPWLATEFVPGPTLHHEVHARGAVIGPRVVGLAAGLADALVAIHAAGLVHRDLKPANILLAPDAPKVIDFGISLAADATVLTTTGTLVGSPAYMSPEQAKGGRDVGAAADIFSWAGCMTFAGKRKPPFGEGEAAGLLYKVVHEPPDLAGLAPALLPFVEAALDKDPANRPTALELVAGLTAVLDGVPAPRLLAPPGGPARVLVATGAADAGRVLARTWSSDPHAVEEAERTLAEAYDLRASLPPRAEDRSRRDRIRAKRAVFASMLIALVAVVAVGIATVRPGQTGEAKPAGTGLAGDPGPATTIAPDPYAGAEIVPAASTSTVVSDPAPAPGGQPAQPGPTAPPTTAAPSSLPSSPVTPATVAPTCSSQLVSGSPADAANRLPTAQTGSGGPAPTYQIRVSATPEPGSTVALVRTSGSPTPEQRDAWRKAVPAGASSFDLGPFAMLEGPGETSTGAVTVHRETRGATFVLQLRPPGGTPVACGTFLGPLA